MMNSATPTQIDQLRATDVTSGLNAILNTDKFMASPQMSAFLKYVVEQTLIGNTRRIKAFTVGIEALGKPASFDPQTDPSVRVLAKRLRSSLDTYYAQNLDTEVFIEMKPGSYVPKFLLRSEMPVNMPVNAPSALKPEQTTNTDDTAQTFESREMAQQPMERPAPTNHEAHLSVQQHGNVSSNASNGGSEHNTNSDDKGDRKSNISQLWHGYKSPSKVA